MAAVVGGSCSAGIDDLFLRVQAGGCWGAADPDSRTHGGRPGMTAQNTYGIRFTLLKLS